MKKFSRISLDLLFGEGLGLNSKMRQFSKEFQQIPKQNRKFISHISIISSNNIILINTFLWFFIRNEYSEEGYLLNPRAIQHWARNFSSRPLLLLFFGPLFGSEFRQLIVPWVDVVHGAVAVWKHLRIHRPWMWLQLKPDVGQFHEPQGEALEPGKGEKIESAKW